MNMSRMKFVQDQWEKLSEGYLKKRTGLSIESPHIVISEIVFDAENWNEYSAKRYEFFKGLLCKYLKSALADYIPLLEEYKQLIQALNSKDVKEIDRLSNALKSSFETGEYFTKLSSFIRTFLASESSAVNNIARPKAVIHQLYVELVLRGYDVDEVRNLFSNIFAPCQVTADGKLNIRFPTYLIPDRRIMSTTEVTDYINNLSFHERLLYLDKHFFSNIVDGYCAFLVKGIAIIERIDVGDVLFLPPGLKSVDFQGVEIDLKHLSFREDSLPELYPICVVRCKGATGTQTAKDAISKFEIVLRTTLLYFNTKMRISADSTSWVIYNFDGEFRSFKYSSKIQDQQVNALQLTSDKLAYLENGLLPVEGSKTDTDTINSALYWYGRASIAEDSAEKLLFYWISIECLFNGNGIDRIAITGGGTKEKIDLILAVIKAAMLLSELHDQIWDVYTHFYEKAFWMQESSGIPAELLQRFKRESGDSIYVWDVVEMLPKLIECEKDFISKGDFNSLLRDFSSVNDHEKLVNRVLEEISNEVQLLYRFRNLIVHSAFKDAVLLPYFTWVAGTYSGVLLRSVRKDMKKGLTIDQSINRMAKTVDRYKTFLGQGEIPCLNDNFLNVK